MDNGEEGCPGPTWGHAEVLLICNAFNLRAGEVCVSVLHYCLVRTSSQLVDVSLCK